MAATGTVYYSNVGQPYYSQSPDIRKVETIYTTDVVPKVPQSVTSRAQPFYRQQYRSDSTSTPSNFGPAQNIKPEYQDTSKIQTTLQDATCYSPKRKLQTLQLPQRSEHLKRRPSLTARIRSSKTVKRLRGQMKEDSGYEEGDDAGTSASECDYSGSTVYGSRTSLLPHAYEPSHRRSSEVSSLASGIESSLVIKAHGERDRQSSCTSQTSSRLMDSSDSASTRTTNTTWSSASKRSRIPDDDGFERDDEDDSDRVGKRPSSTVSTELEQPQLFACPFAKFDRKRYSAANLEETNYRGCSQCLLTDLARVKQHLYRVHLRPQHYCLTCFEVFKSQNLRTAHANAGSCSPKPCPFNEKITPEQLPAIKVKKRGMDLYVGWYEIYRTLFPGAQLPTSPYAAFTAEADDLEVFMQFLERELPLRLRHQVGARNPTMDILQASLPDIIRGIRRDFNPAVQPKTESAGRVVEDTTLQDPPREIPDDLKFHQLATLDPSEQTNPRLARPSVIEIPPNMYVYPPSPSTPVASHPASSQVSYSSRQVPNNIGVTYSQPHMNYNMQDHNMMQGLNSDQVTAIRQPTHRESQAGYFMGQHTSPDPLPAFALRQVSVDNWFPVMESMVPDASMNHFGMYGMIGDIYQNGFDPSSQ